MTLGMIHDIAVPSRTAARRRGWYQCVYILSEIGPEISEAVRETTMVMMDMVAMGAGNLGVGLVHVILDDVELVHGDHLVAEQYAHSAAERLVEVTRGWRTSGKWKETARSLSVILVRSMSLRIPREVRCQAPRIRKPMITAPMMKPACALLIMRADHGADGLPVTMPPP